MTERNRLAAETIALAIIAVALAVPVVRYALAFQAAEPALDLFGLRLDASPLTGLAFGLSYEAAAFLGIREGVAARRRGLKSWWWPALSALVQTAVGAGIVVPVLMAGLRGQALQVLLGVAGGWAWTVAVALATLLTFVTVSAALAVQPAAHSVKGTTQVRAANQAAAQRAPYRVCTACGYPAASVQAWAGHCRGAQHKARIAAQERAEEDP